VSKLARRHVTVSLSGDGGDEIFGGYHRHLPGDSLWQRGAGNSTPVRAAVARVLRAVPVRGWDFLFKALGPVLPAALQVAMPGDRIHKLARLAGATSEADLYERLISMWYPSNIVLGASARSNPDEMAAGLDVLGERMMVRDTLRYLPNDILAKVDRAGMSVSLETRMPFLDYRVLELAWRLPAEHKLAGRVGKRVLRTLLHRYVPPALVERPKMGFRIPLYDWLRGPLREWGETLLDPVRIGREGFLDPVPISAAWREHKTGRRDWSHQLWNVLMFQAWLERYGHTI
jgi:asparagine synthase (glutamine-hydrolysing)